MPEYSQYIPTAPVDWGGITQNILEKLDKVEQEREAKRVELDKQYSDVVSIVDKYQGSKSPTFNQFVMDGANNVRNYLYEQNQLLKRGMITPSEYSRIVSTTKDGWGRLSDLTKQYDANYEEGLKRIEEGKAAGQELYQRQITADLLNLKGKTTFINPKDGRMYIAKVDPETGKVAGDADLYDIQTINAGLNQNVDKVNVSNEVNAYVKNLGSEARMVNGRYVISQSIRGKFNSKTKPEIIDAITNNPRKAASVLADNTDEKYSFTNNAKEIQAINSQIEKLSAQKQSVKSDEDKKAIQKEINALSSQRDKTILLVRDENGIFTPKLSEEQMKKAKSIVNDVIESQIDYKEEKPEKGPIMSYSERKDIVKGQEEVLDMSERLKQLNDLWKNKASSKYAGLIKNADVSVAFPKEEGRVVGLRVGTGFNNKDKKFIRVAKPIYDPKTKARIKDEEYDIEIGNDEREYKNVINSLINQKYGTKFAFPDIEKYSQSSQPIPVSSSKKGILN